MGTGPVSQMHHTLCPGVHPLHTVQESPITLQVQKSISPQVECFLSQWLQDAVVAIWACSQGPGFGTLFTLGKKTTSDPFIPYSVSDLDGRHIEQAVEGQCLSSMRL